MLNEFAREWVQALRSGNYKQGKRFLHSVADEYCCLGVVCELAIKHGIIGPSVLQDTGPSYGYGNLGCYAGAPGEVMDWIKLKDSIGQFDHGCLAHLNDAGKTFNEIADIIESEPKGLFQP